MSPTQNPVMTTESSAESNEQWTWQPYNVTYPNDYEPTLYEPTFYYYWYSAYYYYLVCLLFLILGLLFIKMAVNRRRRLIAQMQLRQQQARQAVVDNIQLEAGYPGHQQLVLNDKPPAYDEVMLALGKQQSLEGLEGVPGESRGAIMGPSASTATVDTVVDVGAFNPSTTTSSANDVHSELDNSSPPSYEQTNNTLHTHSN